MNEIEKTPFPYPYANGSSMHLSSHSKDDLRKNPRYDIANRSLKELFHKWLAIPNIELQIDKLIHDFKNPDAREFENGALSAMEALLISLGVSATTMSKWCKSR